MEYLLRKGSKLFKLSFIIIDSDDSNKLKFVTNDFERIIDLHAKSQFPAKSLHFYVQLQKSDRSLAISVEYKTLESRITHKILLTVQAYIAERLITNEIYLKNVFAACIIN